MASNLQASSMQLTIEDLPVIQDALTPIAYKCIIFGSKINVEHPVLAGIDKSNTDFDEKLYKVLEYRLKQLPLLTWHDIVRALRSPAVHEYALASQIGSQYIPITSSQLQPVIEESSTLCQRYGDNALVHTQHLHPHFLPHNASVSGSSLQSHSTTHSHSTSSPFHQAYHSQCHSALLQHQPYQFPCHITPSFRHPSDTQSLRHVLSPQHPSGRALTGKRSFSQLSVGSSAATAAHMDLLETCVQPEMSVTPSKRPHLEPESLLSHLTLELYLISSSKV